MCTGFKYTNLKHKMGRIDFSVFGNIYKAYCMCAVRTVLVMFFLNQDVDFAHV